MTTIAGIVHRDRVYLGAESAITYGDNVEIGEPKVWTVGEIAIGAAGGLRGIQLIKHTLKVPKLPTRKSDDALRLWLTKDFAGAVSECLAVDNIKRKNAPCYLIGVRGWLVYVDSWLDWLRPADGLAAIGNGGQVALASLRSTTHLRRTKERIRIALDRACEMTNASRPPYTYVSA